MSEKINIPVHRDIDIKAGFELRCELSNLSSNFLGFHNSLSDVIHIRQVQTFEEEQKRHACGVGCLD